MGKSKLTNDEWLALFAEEKAGVPRAVLAPKWGVFPGTINGQAIRRGLTRRQTGAPDHRVRPVGVWPENKPTTTPRPTRALIALRDEPSCALTRAGTADNADHLSAGFVESLRALYGATRREAQEIEGRVVDLDGALFTAEMMAAARSPSPSWGGELDRVIVALDPTATAAGDACGIVVAGSRRRPDGRREAVVLADRSVHGLSPDQWARRAVRAAEEFGATAIVPEVNQGGDMVAAVLGQPAAP